jgi:phosphoribosylglycinamide formyltransferase 1
MFTPPDTSHTGVVKKIVVLASGSGSNFQSIIESVHNGRIDAEVAGLIAGKPGIGAIKRAEKAGIPVTILNAATAAELSSQLRKAFEAWKPDLIVLAGFLKKIPDDIVKAWEGKIINIHPSLLPKYGGKGYYGIHVHRAVIEAGETESGCSVHFVNETYDDGDIIRQVKVPVQPGDTPETLAGRVLSEEHKLLPAVISELLNRQSQP